MFVVPQHGNIKSRKANHSALAPQLGDFTGVKSVQRRRHMFAGWVLITIVGIFSASRVTVVVIALRGVESKRKAEVLVALAQCFRWWRWRG
jgi:hypothetical protein